MTDTTLIPSGVCWQCFNCDESFPDSTSATHESSVWLGQGEGWGVAFWCDDCFADCWGTSDCCDEVYSLDEGLNCSCECECCDDDDSHPRSSAVHGYSWKPYPKFHGEGDYYFGVELESENVEGSLREACDVVNRRDPLEDSYYLKDDGSLNYGVEWVSHPRTLASWQEWTSLQSILSDLSSNGQRAWTRERCGLHVHVSRTAFSGSGHLGRFVMFFARYESQVVEFAGRRSGYASFWHLGEEIVNKVKDGSNHSSHGSALNLTLSDTVEVRVFKPSLKVGRVLACVEFVDALISFTRGVTSADVALGRATWQDFDSFVRADVRFSNCVRVLDGERF